MNRLYRLLLTFLVLSLNCFSHVNAGALPKWPGVNYAYAKVFLYNLEGNLHGHHSPVKNGVPDPTLVGDGIRLSQESESALRRWLTQDLSLLHEGLSGCYIPHHAIIFYNEKNDPIAWMSACFLCSGIRFYSPVPKLPKAVYSKKNEAKAEQQLTELKSLLKNAGVPVLYAQEQYYMLHHRYEFFSNERVCVDEQFISRYFPFDFPMSKMMTVVDSFDKVQTTISFAGSDKSTADVFYQYSYKNSRFWFSGKNPESAIMVQARITGETIAKIMAFPFEINALTVFSCIIYEGLPYPTTVLIHNQKGNAIRFSNYEGKIAQVDVFTDWKSP